MNARIRPEVLDTVASIVSQQRFLSDAQCAELVAYANEAMPERAVHGPNTIFSGRYIDHPPCPLAEAAARKAATLVGLAFETRLALETFQLVVWPEGSEQAVSKKMFQGVIIGGVGVPPFLVGYVMWKSAARRARRNRG